MNCKTNNLYSTNKQRNWINTPDEQKYNNGDLDLVIKLRKKLPSASCELSNPSAILSGLLQAFHRPSATEPFFVIIQRTSTAQHPLEPVGDSGGSIFDKLLLLRIRAACCW